MRQRLLVWSGLLIMIDIAAVVGMINLWLYVTYSNQYNIIRDQADQTGEAVTNYLVPASIVWGVISAYISGKAENKFERMQTAVYENDLDAFLRWAEKRMSLTIRALHLIISILLVRGLHSFHMSPSPALVEVHFFVAFLVTILILFLADLENPIQGIVNIEDVPQEWRSEIKKRKAARKKMRFQSQLIDV